MNTSSLAENPQNRTHESTPLYVAGRPRPVAFVVGDTLRKGIHPQHYLRRPAGAIAFDESVICDAQAAGARRIEVRDRDAGTVYRCDMTTFRRRGFHVGRGFGDQWALERGWWSIDGAPAELTERERVQEAARSQLTLWGCK